jgi:Cytochrome c554 and c-prime
MACRQQISKEKESEPPLLLEDAAPIQQTGASNGPVADNSRCYVCHANFETEALTLVHARADIGCQECHGASDAHCSDEDNVTPPDKMYPIEKIKPFCMSCHTKEKIDIPVHNTIIAETDPKKARCTACHGQHRLAHRTRRWDRVTRKLIQDDGVRMTTDQMLNKDQQ